MSRAHSVQNIRGSGPHFQGHIRQNVLAESIDKNILLDKNELRAIVNEMRDVAHGQLHPVVFYRLHSALNNLRGRVNVGWSIAVVFESAKVIEKCFVEKSYESRIDASTKKRLLEIAKVLVARKEEIEELKGESFNEKIKNKVYGISRMLSDIAYHTGIES
ncbi:MAG: hypothetical protein N3G80_01170 [Candidatus Micrarchaeota archaeon]|nr:hypothetical protein [Candidatus Micrarchaeota archaeon]